MKNKTVLSIKNLHISFKLSKRKGLLNIIRGVDINLKEGEIIGIVGESGSGKSVTTKSFMNVNHNAVTTFDELTIFDQKYKDSKTTDWKKIRGSKISYIPQNPMTSMNPSRKISAHIFDVLKYYRKDLSTKISMEEYALSILNKFKIVNPKMVLNLYPHELSGGMKQRIIIAMAIMSGSKIIIADEPTTALDSTVQASVLELLQDINKEFKVSIIFISHNIAVVAKLCNYIYVMYAGKVVERGSKKDVFIQPTHPYTWALIASIPEDKDKSEKLYTIPGNPPNMAQLPAGDPFAYRNEFAVDIDFKKEPPLFEVDGKRHMAATWMLHPLYPKVKMPEAVKNRLDQIRKVLK